MKERQILFKGEMVRAILEGRKTQTRRIVKGDGIKSAHKRLADGYVGTIEPAPCPYGQPGDRLYVRETWDFRDWRDSASPTRVRISFAADGGQAEHDAPADWNPMVFGKERWRPGIHMPRWASRIALEVTGARVERVQDITMADVIAEGVKIVVAKSDVPGKVIPMGSLGKHGTCHYLPKDPTEADFYRAAYASLWDSINEKRASWASNPWVWRVEFKRVDEKA